MLYTDPHAILLDKVKPGDEVSSNSLSDLVDELCTGYTEILPEDERTRRALRVAFLSVYAHNYMTVLWGSTLPEVIAKHDAYQPWPSNLTWAETHPLVVVRDLQDLAGGDPEGNVLVLSAANEQHFINSLEILGAIEVYEAA